jgi:hypothetical protein
MESKDLAAPGVQGQPQPLLVGLLADKAAEVVRFSLQGRDQEWIAVPRGLYIKVRGRCRVALDQKAHQPGHAHAYGTANAAQEEPFLEQSFDQRPALGRDPALGKLPDKLAATGFTAMVLFTVVDVTVLLVVPRAAPRANISHDHDQRIDLCGSRVLGNLSPDRRRALHESHHPRAGGASVVHEAASVFSPEYILNAFCPH